ncbi:MAG: hypothetical protein M0P01_01330 [Treponema sp.]|nr:hypothetical protein [Treponema sp.]
MKKTGIFVCTAAVFLFAAGSVFSQDDTSAGFSDDFSSDFNTTGTAVSGSSTGSSAVTTGGEAELNGRVYVDEENSDGSKKSFSDWDAEATPKGKLDIKYEGSKTDVELKLNFNEDVFTKYQADIIDELTMRAYLGDFTLEGGKMKVVWGKGDKLHVLDNFNANNYTDFLIPDYIDRRLAEPMFRIVYNAPKNIAQTSSIRLEGIYTPFMTADRYATSGRWTPASYTALSKKVTQVEENKLAGAWASYVTAQSTYSTLASLASEYSAAASLYTLTNYADTYKASYTAAKAAYDAAIKTALGKPAEYTVTQAEENSAVTSAETALSESAEAYATTLSDVSAFSADDLYPDMYQLKYGQAGARLTATTGMVDWGLSYYYGHYKQPSVDWSGYITSAVSNSGASLVNPSLDYDRLQVFGTEGAVTLGGFNFRGEFAYNLTDDVSGDDPWTHNNSLGWVFGFDKDLPVNNININIQTIGTYILKKDKLEDGTYKAYDVDYDENGIYSNDKIVLNISDSYNHEKVKPEVSIIYGIERSDFIVMPKITYRVADGLDIIGKGLYITNFDDDSKSEFSSFLNNSFFQLGMKYTF